MAKSAPKKICLVYFNARGRAEPTRLTLAHANIPFEDKRYEMSEWPAHKASSPWGSLPYMEADGKVMGQSLAISRYAAKIAGIYGSTPEDQAKQDAIVDVLKDFFEKWGTLAFAQDDAAKAEAKKKMDDCVIPNLERLEKMLGKDTYFGGSKVSWADLHFFAVMETYEKTGLSSYFDKCDKLKAMCKKVKEQPNIKKYLEKRKDTQF